MEKTQKTQRNIWMAMFVISIIGVILMALYELVFYQQNTSSSKISSITGNLVTRSANEERLYFWFYFTFISNMFGVALSGASIFKANMASKHWQRAKVMMAVNLLITFLVYWIVLAKGANWHEPLAVISNIFVHLITPVLAIVAFLYESIKDKTTKRTITAVDAMLWTFIFPVVWLIAIIILYYATGGKESSAIYAVITDFNYHKLAAGLTITGIGIAYPLLILGATYLYARKLR